MKLGMIGLGFMGRTHLQALKNIPEADVIAVASDDPVALTGDLTSTAGNLGTSGERFDFSRMRKYRDWQEAVRDPEVEAFDICLPTHLHAPAAIAALEAGKHVLVEKPMALDGDETDRMLEAAQRAGRLLMTAQVLRFYPDYLPLADIARSGRAGALRMAMFRRRCAAPSWGQWLPDPAKSGGGVFDLLIHDVDMCLHLFGKPQAVSAIGSEDLAKGIDLITATCHYPDGATVVITGGWHHANAYPFSMEYTVSFDGGTAEYSSAGRPPAFYRQDGEAETLAVPVVNGYESEIRYFLECASTGRKPELCPAEESAAAVKLMRLLAASRADNGKIVPCAI
ncbi:MAG: Gfo/Idh/MocA family oxidoreductase [Bryobacteraceae bacterium]|nr:Gfo/Idh/MocA family oxidoreductase [Bryobacteraceae bacterium]